ncbi:MAG: YdcF family protein [Aminivibrio sp.]|jgi:uncharacterized SAM-binding protein YcdF (DUF218 family)
MTFWYFLYKAAGNFLTPPGLFVTAAVAGGIYCRRKKTKDRGPSVLLFSLAAVLYVFSLPLTARLLLDPLESPYPLEVQAGAGKNAIALVLAGGVWSADENDEVFMMSAETTQRFLAGVSAARKLGTPLLYSGGYPEKAGENKIEDMVKRAASAAGYEGELLVEGRSRTTWENFLLSSEIIRGGGWDKVIVVTSGFHLKRSMRLAEKFLSPLAALPLSSGRLVGTGRFEASDLLPSPGGLRNAALAIRELAGFLAYEFYDLARGGIARFTPGRP